MDSKVVVIDSREYARAFVFQVMQYYWGLSTQSYGVPEERLRSPFKGIDRLSLLSNEDDLDALNTANSIYSMPFLDASYQVGELYTRLLPNNHRSKYGVYFTPPGVTNRLLDNVENAGIDWATSKIVDPACGGGAFLAPIALRMRASLKAKGFMPSDVLDSISTRLSGYEIDPFSAWLSQVFIDIVLLEDIMSSGERFPVVVRVADTLKLSKHANYDLVVGNPPYSKIKLEPGMREQYSRSLYGHANLYGLFVDKALSMLNDHGVLGYVTPTSFLSGQYFKKLRLLLSKQTKPVQFDFIETRAGVFADVLQETLLTVFQKADNGSVRTMPGSSTVFIARGSTRTVSNNGSFSIPVNESNPWLIPRNKEQATLLKSIPLNCVGIGDYGYQISTGPLVWNRHKGQLRSRSGRSRLPLIWAESVQQNGVFEHKSERRNHLPWFLVSGQKDNWLIVTKSCLLLQRTTAKEQRARLVAAEMPQVFIDVHGGVVVENHLNMIFPVESKTPIVSIQALQKILTSKVVDRLFRTMNGSVAVSAYELEALPLPSIDKALEIQRALESGFDNDELDRVVEGAYREQLAEVV